MTFMWRGVSETLRSYRQHFKYLLVFPFLVALAVASYKIGHSSSALTKETKLEDTLLHRERRDVTVPTENLNNMKQGESINRSTPRLYEHNIGGAVYTRWGRTECATGSDAVYRGVAGGSWFDHTGGGSNYLCLPLEPIWGTYNEAVEKGSKLYGSEYQNPSGFGLNNNHNRPLHDNNVPCVVCRSQTKTSVVMIPARNQCYNGWNTEYTGYLMSGNVSHKGRTEFVCMDGQPESDPSGYRDENGAVFYSVEGVCGSLPCPPYVPRREITCAVCTK